MGDQKASKRGVFPDHGLEMTVRDSLNACRAPVFAFVGKVFVKQDDGTVTEQLSWIVPAEREGDFVHCPQCSCSEHHGILASHLCSAKQDSDIAHQEQIRPEIQEAELGTGPQGSTNTQQQIHFTVPIEVAVLAVVLALVCGVVHSTAPVSITLGIVLLWKLSLVSSHTREPQPQPGQAETRLDECREPAGPSRRIRIADVLSEEEPNPTRRIRIRDSLSKDESSENLQD